MLLRQCSLWSGVEFHLIGDGAELTVYFMIGFGFEFHLSCPEYMGSYNYIFDVANCLATHLSRQVSSGKGTLCLVVSG